MRVQVDLPSALAELIGGRREISVAIDGEHTTVGQVLDVVAGVHPGLVRRIREDDGGLRRYMDVYADGVDVRTLDLERTRLRDGAVVQVLPSTAGG